MPFNMQVPRHLTFCERGRFSAITLASTKLTPYIASQAEGWVFEFQLRQTLVVKTGSDSSTVQCSVIGVRVTGPRRLPL